MNFTPVLFPPQRKMANTTLDAIARSDLVRNTARVSHAATPNQTKTQWHYVSVKGISFDRLKLQSKFAYGTFTRLFETSE